MLGLIVSNFFKDLKPSADRVILELMCSFYEEIIEDYEDVINAVDERESISSFSQESDE